MASISKEIVIDASAERVWEALRDWGGLHVRLVPGFATDARLDGEDRIVRFFNGSVLRERLVNLDDDARRLVWSIADPPYAHHNASAQVFADGERPQPVRMDRRFSPERARRSCRTANGAGAERDQAHARGRAAGPVSTVMASPFSGARRRAGTARSE